MKLAVGDQSFECSRGEYDGNGSIDRYGNAVNMKVTLNTIFRNLQTCENHVLI